MRNFIKDSSNINKYETKTFYICCRCECGGDINKRVNNTEYMTMPSMRDYVCSTCGKEYVLRDGEYPHTVIEIIR